MIVVSVKCAKDSVTISLLRIIYKLQAIEIQSSLSVNLCVCILDHGNTNISSDGVKVLDFPPRLQNYMFGHHTWEVWGPSNIWQGNTFCSGMVGQMDCVL